MAQEQSKPRRRIRDLTGDEMRAEGERIRARLEAADRVAAPLLARCGADAADTDSDPS